MVRDMEEVLEVLKMEDPAIAKAEEILEWLSCNKETMRLYELRQKKVYDEVTRLNGAKDEGRREKALEVARNMLHEGIPYFLFKIVSLWMIWSNI